MLFSKYHACRQEIRELFFENSSIYTPKRFMLSFCGAQWIRFDIMALKFYDGTMIQNHTNGGVGGRHGRKQGCTLTLYPGF